MLERLFLLLALLPYCGPVVLFPTQVQPWSGLLAWGLTLIRLLGAGVGRLRVRLRDGVLMVLALGFAVHVSGDSPPDLFLWLRSTVVFVFSLGLLFAAAHIRVRALRGALLVAVVAYLLVALLQYAAPALYEAVAGVFVQVKHVVPGARGASSLAPEATDFGFTMVYIVLLALIARRLDPAPPRLARGPDLYHVILGLAVLNVLLSQAAAGLIALVVVLGLAPGAGRPVPARIALGLAGGLALALLLVGLPDRVVEGVRGLRLFALAVSDPAALLQTSFAYRAAHLTVGGLALIESGGIGYGAGAFPAIAPDLFARHDLAGLLHLTPWHAVAVHESLGQRAIGVLPMLMAEQGVAGLLFFGLLLSIVWRSPMPCRGAALALLALTWLQSLPAAFPLFWVVLGLARAPAVTALRAGGADA